MRDIREKLHYTPGTYSHMTNGAGNGGQYVFRWDVYKGSSAIC